MLHPTERFSSRVDDYVKYRPTYPAEILPFLASECGFDARWRVADVGSGPGNLTRLFLDHGNPVVGVEPNRAMREAGERLMASYTNFESVAGTAEATTLPNASFDLITAGQAFHWFDPNPTRIEFRRILRQGGWVALVWNDRQLDVDRFAREYERILWDFAPGYGEVNHLDPTNGQKIEAFFGRPPRRAAFPSAQEFGWDGFLGRVLSSSYVPQRGVPGHDEIVAACERLFQEESVDGRVRFAYQTEVFLGHF